MASEIKYQTVLSAKKGAFTLPQISDTLSVDMSGTGLFQSIISIPTTAGGTVITFSNLTTPGIVYIKNLDQTNLVTYGPTSGGAIVSLGQLKPNETAILRLASGVSLRMIATTATCQVQIAALET